MGWGVRGAGGWFGLVWLGGLEVEVMVMVWVWIKSGVQGVLDVGKGFWDSNLAERSGDARGLENRMPFLFNSADKLS